MGCPEEIKKQQEQIKNLEEKLDTVNHENECLILCNDTLQEELEEATDTKKETESKDKENKTLRQTINNMKIREAKNKAEHDKADQELKQLKTTVDKLNKEIAELREKTKNNQKEQKTLILGDSNAKRFTPMIKKDNKAVEIAMAYTSKDLLKYVKENKGKNPRNKCDN